MLDKIVSILSVIDNKYTRKRCESMVNSTVSIFDAVDSLSITDPLRARLISLSSHEIALKLAKLVPTALSRPSKRNFLVQNGTILSNISLSLFFMFFSLLYPSVHAYAQDEKVAYKFNSNEIIISKEKKREYMEQAFDAYSACEQDVNYSRSYDCKCIASQLYEVRLETGYFFTDADILKNSLEDCKDTPKMAGTHYNQCLGWSAAMRRNADEFCECYGNVMAMNFDKGNFTSARAEEGIMSIAMTECNVKHPKDGKIVNQKIEKKKNSKFSKLFSIFEN